MSAPDAKQLDDAMTRLAAGDTLVASLKANAYGFGLVPAAAAVVAAGADESDAVTLTAHEPTVVGVPEIVPVAASSASPGGRFVALQL